ncbi:MAG: prolyl oligopeptidase family serine peptidase [Bacteroidota bacterium]
MPYLPIIGLLFLSWNLSAQNPDKKTMSPAVYDLWSTIRDPQITGDGQWASYALHREDKDDRQCLYRVSDDRSYFFDRGQDGRFSYDDRFFAFRLRPAADSLKALRRRGVEKDDLPRDTLALFDLTSGRIQRIPGLHRFVLPKKWSGSIAYLLHPNPQDSQATTKANTHHLVIRELGSGRCDTFPAVTHFSVAETAPRILFGSTGQDSTFRAGLYLYEADTRRVRQLLDASGEFQQLALDRPGRQAAFLADLDTTDARVRPFQLYYWQADLDSAQQLPVPTPNTAASSWRISEAGKVYFSENGQRLFYGTAPPPLLADTSLLEEEIVQVEVWHYLDKRTYPHQKIDLEDDRKRSYLAYYDTQQKRFQQLGAPDQPELKIGAEGNAQYALAQNEGPYLEKISWEGFPAYKDLSAVDLSTGKVQPIAPAVRANPQVSPEGNFAYWYSTPDSAWFSYSFADQQLYRLAGNELRPFYNELNDMPMYPYPYGAAGWLADDQALLLYDRYDIWRVDPRGRTAPQRLTAGREAQTIYRYHRSDPEARFIDPDQPGLLRSQREGDRAEAYHFLDWATGQLSLLLEGDYALSRRPLKARERNDFLFTRESFTVFPDLLLARDANFAKARRISRANPQQDEYSWGTIELFEWTSLDGQPLRGLLVKPENFDPQKKYPLLVNFYERSSQGLHRHRAPYPHRSTINYSYYANRGYVIFNPDVPYRVGYPGESALQAVTSGVTALLNEGYIDAQRMGVQGHSWGGYQVAHLLTKTNIFRCAESGAPVVNMFSAYGGIRWRSGLSRMFQYEHTQSRIGGTIWEYPLRYLENSPLFALDKVETPVLILHNDKDGAVPWYQGIEYFMGLRRLGKPAWMLNYNDEPHWPVKRQNRLDFNLRMQQFFDHYLRDAPRPRWMERGVPALEKGIEQGLELEGE